MAQDKTVCYDCRGCERADVDFELIPGSEDMYYDEDSEEIIWEAEYRCPHCGQTMLSMERYEFFCDDLTWYGKEE